MIDCLFIGYNKIPFSKYKVPIKLYESAKLDKILECIPVKTELHALYNIMKPGWIRYKNELYTVSEIYDIFRKGSESKEINNIPQKEILNSTIAYLGTFLNKRGFTFDFINIFNNEQEQLIKILQNDDLRAIAIPTTFYTMSDPIIEIIKFVRKYNSKVKVIVGGPFILDQVKNMDKRKIHKFLADINADFYVVNSQGEFALTEILHALKMNLSFSKIKNIIYKRGQEFVTNLMEQENNQLDENIVDWNLFRNKISNMIVVRTSISCPFSCAFCQFPQMGGKYQSVSIDTIEKEFDLINSIEEVKRILIIDDTFNVPPERFKSILKMMIKKKYKFKWNSFLRCQYIDREIAELMKESGCETVTLGIESANQRILNNMNKKVTVHDLQRGLSLLNEYDITSIGCFIIGFPGETLETAQDTIRFIENYKPTFYRLSPWACLPLSPVCKDKNKYNLKNKNAIIWSHNTMDSKTAYKIVNDAILKIENSIQLPGFGFNIDSIMNDELDMVYIKELLRAFNSGLKEKLLNSSKRGIDPKLWKTMADACQGRMS